MKNYRETQRSPAKHLPSIVMVGLLHVLVGYALVSGLARKVVEVIKAPIETKIIEEIKKPLHDHPFLARLPYKMRFPRSRLYISALIPAAIGFVGGLLVSILGIGGGFLLVPAMIYILGMPTLLVAGTSLFQILIPTIIATIMHAVANHTVDLVLALLLIIGGVVGAQVGVRVARRIRGVYARIILAALLLFVSVELAGELFIRPIELYSTTVR